jgi:hypothetical protein
MSVDVQRLVSGVMLCRKYLPVAGAFWLMHNGVAATLTVTNLNDSGSGSLRQAIENAVPGDTINFLVTGTITLTSGNLLITNDLTISGPGGIGVGISGNFVSRVFQIETNATVAFSGMTIRDGRANDGIYPSETGGGGGGLYNAGTLTLVGCSIIGNTCGNGATGLNTNAGWQGGYGGAGGGIYNSGTLSLTACTVSGNRAGAGGTGGSSWNFGTRGGNGGDGGGIYSVGSLQLTACTISGNFAGNGGAGGLGPDLERGGPGWAGSGGGLSSGNAILQSVTVAGNQIGTGAVSYHAAGIHSRGSIYLKNTLVGRNFITTTNFISDVKGLFVSQGYNFVETGDGSIGLTDGTNADQVGTLAGPLDAKLGALQDNGGPTMTRALLIGSPAIDRGSSDGLTTDQRGRPRPVDDPAIVNAAGGDGSDIGAFELQSQPVTLLQPVKNGSNVVIQFPSEVGQTYRIERKGALTSGTWTTIADNVTGTGRLLQLTEPASAMQRFYRVATR